MNKAKTTNKFWIADRLAEIRDGNATVSYYHKRILVALGYLTATEVKTNAGPGRGTVVYELSGKARGFLALSRNWRRAA